MKIDVISIDNDFQIGFKFVRKPEFDTVSDFIDFREEYKMLCATDKNIFSK